MSGAAPLSKGVPISPDSARLPKEVVDRLTKPLARFLRIESLGGAVLLLATIAALIIANSPGAALFSALWETEAGIQLGSLQFARPLKDWIDDGLMTLFFFLVALELKRELVLGELKNPRVAALSIASALGGMLVPAALYLALQPEPPGNAGWGVVMATDTAFVVGCLALLGSRIPAILRVFMLSLAIVDDVGAILVVAIGYSGELSWKALALAAVGVVVVRAMAVIGIRSIPLYFVVGASIWLAVDASGIHATITGVILGLLTPAHRWVSDQRLYAILDRVIAHPDSEGESGGTRDRQTLQLAVIAARETLSPVERLELGLHPWVGLFIMPLFALANAGIPLSATHTDPFIVAATFAGLTFGKPIGILTFSWVALRLGLAMRPPDLSWRLLVGGGALAGIGFTMSLFIANLAFSAALLNSAKVGILLATIVSAALGVALLLWLPGRETQTRDA